MRSVGVNVVWSSLVHGCCCSFVLGFRGLRDRGRLLGSRGAGVLLVAGEVICVGSSGSACACLG